MFKRIAILLAVGVIGAAAIFAAVAVWFLPSWEAKTDKVPKWSPVSLTQAKVRKAYRIDRQGRKLGKGSGTAAKKQAEEKYLEALSLFRKLNHERGEAEVLNDLGILYEDLHEYAKAVECYEESLEIKRKVGWSWGEGNTLTNLGNLYQKRDLSKAAECYDLAVKAYEKAGDIRSAEGATEQLGDAYVGLCQYRKAEETMETLLRKARKTKNRRTESYALGALGSLCITQHQYAPAVKYLEESLEIGEKVRDTSTKLLVLQGLGIAYGFLGQDTRAIEAYEKALQIAVNRNCLMEQIQISAGLAELGYRREDYAKAADYCVKALEIARKFNDRDAEARICEILGMICRDWERTDPGNSDLERAKIVLYKGAV